MRVPNLYCVRNESEETDNSNYDSVRLIHGRCSHLDSVFHGGGGETVTNADQLYVTCFTVQIY